MLKEQHKRFLGLQKDLDDCEKLVGGWNPQNNFYNLYETIENVQDDIDEFNAENEETAPTPTSAIRGSVPQTPGGSMRGTISKKIKDFNN